MARVPGLALRALSVGTRNIRVKSRGGVLERVLAERGGAGVHFGAGALSQKGVLGHSPRVGRRWEAKGNVRVQDRGEVGAQAQFRQSVFHPSPSLLSAPLPIPMDTVWAHRLKKVRHL